MMRTFKNYRKNRRLAKYFFKLNEILADDRLFRQLIKFVEPFFLSFFERGAPLRLLAVGGGDLPEQADLGHKVVASGNFAVSLQQRDKF